MTSSIFLLFPVLSAAKSESCKRVSGNMENKAVPKRVVYFDVLNVLACLCVIGMHCNGAVHVFSDTYVWRQSLLVDVLAYWAVPVFIMLSGATLMNYRRRYSTKVFF